MSGGEGASNYTATRPILDDMRQAVALARPRGVKLEASGGLSLDVARAVAETGVDFLAVGALTHSAPVLDLGLDLDVRAATRTGAGRTGVPA